jgi:hypothetical protein
VQSNIYDLGHDSTPKHKVLCSNPSIAKKDLKKINRSQVWWLAPVIPITQEEDNGLRTVQTKNWFEDSQTKVSETPSQQRRWP